MIERHTCGQTNNANGHRPVAGCWLVMAAGIMAGLSEVGPHVRLFNITSHRVAAVDQQRNDRDDVN